MTGMDVLGLNPANPSIQYNAPYSHPYASSISSSASSSSSSVFSLDSLSSLSSISSTSTNPVDVIWEHDGEYQVMGRSLPSATGTRVFARDGVPKAADPAVAPELRKHPRRTNSRMTQANGAPVARPPPCLLRQSDRKVNFVDNLVDTASQIVEIIWPLSAVASRSDSATGCKGVLPLRTFIQETLRRSRTSYSTLQVALYYLIKIKEHVPRSDATPEQPSRSKPVCRAMQCGRRMFLAALILASKYLQDRNYSARAWSKISGLNTVEINQNELMFLEAVGWRLHVPEATFQRWTDIVLKYTPGAGGFFAADGQCWRTVLPKLTPELNSVDVDPFTPSSLGGFESTFMADSPSPRSPATAEQTGLPSGYDHRSAHQRYSPLAGQSSFLPSMPRPSMLPTPQLTPQTSVAPTPAASASSFTARRASICAAMSQVQSMCMARSTLDQRPSLAFCPRANTFDGYPTTVRRSSLARSTSSASSPDSMISDVSTLSSSSGFSSCSSTASFGPSNILSASVLAKPRLAVRATLRCTNNALKECRKTLAVASPNDEHSLGDIYRSPETYLGSVGPVSELTNFSLGTPVDHEAAQSLCELSGAVSRPSQTFEQGTTQRTCRKRGRTGSEDLMWQSHVRHLIDLSARNANPAAEGPLSHLLESNPSQPLSAVQLSLLTAGAPVSGPAGMKRACCGSEARKIALNPSIRSEYLG